MNLKNFSEKALQSLSGYYVYALIDPRSDSVFYIGKGIGNRVFAHEIEQDKNPESEKRKLQTIHEIEAEKLGVKRVILNWGLTESEAFAAEAALINYFNLTKKDALTNIVAGHHTHEALTVEDFEVKYGAELLSETDIKHNVLVIKINKRYRRDMSDLELYEAVRGIWKASLNSIKKRNIEYVFGVYNQLIVAVYKPNKWHYVHEMVDVPRKREITKENYEKVKNRVYFTCRDYKYLDDNQKFYLHKSIAALSVNQSAQNPISYLMALENNMTNKHHQTHLFAVKWHNKFCTEQTNYYIFIDPMPGEDDMGEEMYQLGFKMDCGHAFTSVYGNAFNEVKELSKVVSWIDNIDLLGSAIYSKWRYYKHWAYSGAEILNPQNREWFIVALSRLAELTTDC
jgi:hypothetical protein